MTFRPFRPFERLGAWLRGEDDEPPLRPLPVPTIAAAPSALKPVALDIGRRLQERWRQSGREPGVLVALDGDVLVVCADGIRSRIAGTWKRGHYFTAAQMTAMRRPASRFESLRLLNEALQRVPVEAWADELGNSALKAMDELPHGIVRRSPNGDMYVHTYNFAASLVRGRWHVGNRFTYAERQAMAYVQDRAERETIVTIARAVLGVPRTDATYV